MDSKRFAAGTVVGGVVLWATGWLIFSKLFGGFYAANVGSATGVDRDAQILWATILGNAFYAALIVYALLRRHGVASVAQGAMVGAIVGCLAWAQADFVLYADLNIANLTRTIVDPLLEIIHGGIGGAAIAFVVKRMGGSDIALR